MTKPDVSLSTLGKGYIEFTDESNRIYSADKKELVEVVDSER